MYAALLAVVTIIFALLAWRDAKMALALLLGLLPTYLIRFSIGPFPTTLLEILVILSTIVACVTYGPRQIFNIRSPFSWNRPLLLLLAAACFSAAVSPNLIAALGVWKAYFIEPALLFLILRATFREEKDWLTGLNALFLSGCVVAAFAIFQRVSGGMGIPAPWDLEVRATSFFGYPNAAGLFLAPLICAAIVSVFRSVPIRPRIRPDLILVLLGIPALYFCQTEAAYIAVPAGLFLAFLFSGATKKQKILATIAGIACISFLFIASDQVHEKLTLSDTSGVTRKITWMETIEMLKDHPIIGAGLSGYPTVMKPYHAAGYYEIFQYPHNVVLNVWSELGLLGLLAFGWLVVATIQTMRRDQDPSRPPHSWGGDRTYLHLIAFAALATMLVHGLVDVPYFKNDLSMMTWFFVAMMTV